MESLNSPLLEVTEMSVAFNMYNKKDGQHKLKVITDLNINIKEGEILAIVGSSGSGKSLLAHAIMGLLPSNAIISGSIRFGGKDLTPKLQQKLRGKKMALVPQSVTYLDPLMKIAHQVRGEKEDKNKVKQRKIFQRLGLCRNSEQLYPFQLSGGMARRVLVSTAVVSEASLIIADEPTPGMQLEQAIEALKIFRELADEGKAIIIITHDVDLAIEFADKIAVFYAGTTLETASARDFKIGVDALRHPYSKALWKALPQNGFQPIPGFQPYVNDIPKGCLFGPRCPLKTDKCENNIPMKKLRGGYVRCIHAT